ncbi:MAG TPA: SpoIID/LytB domain-containing protein [Smithellaceae bacterium]|nr:SpoIID/LytB domain-containing protein [Smithellaceae bacterium]HRS89673.1 SpoIID/LytB domain-containing protein [Smithellaceae bacterium]HRV25226.1 SpoIID/LytB domain-containing protein [Smithellaceae bacterium]
MKAREPKIKVALLQDTQKAQINLHGDYFLAGDTALTGKITAEISEGHIRFKDKQGRTLGKKNEIFLAAANQASFTIPQVKIGIGFHWQQNQEQTFYGDILLSSAGPKTFHLINIVLLEDYLASVISSEMSAYAHPEFLKAQAVAARSWLMAMLEKKKIPRKTRQAKNKNEIIVWQDVNDHKLFDVCADDHCQRYQGITKIISANAKKAIEETRGLFLASEGKICDARYYKCCGGQTEIFSTAWEDISLPYLQSVTCADVAREPLSSEDDAQEWLTAKPPAFCNTQDVEILKKILPTFDRQTADFYRWRVCYTREELEEILKKKSGIDFGQLQSIEPLARGTSGRIYKLKIVGAKKTVIVGKELEIRRWLSPTHLLSSAFVVSIEKNHDATISKFIFHGGGWGHGVGLCQIGAAVMAEKGKSAAEILAHYFPGAILQKLY